MASITFEPMSVEYIEHMGNDLSVVNAARVSFNKESAWYHDVNESYRSSLENRVLKEADKKLLKYLAKHGHWSPFAHTTIKFRIRASIPVARQLVKHQVGLCVAGDTQITFWKHVNGKGNGTYTKTIRDLFYDKKQYRDMRFARVLNIDTGCFERGKIINVFLTGVKDVYKITTKSGKELKITEDHEIFTNNGFQSLKDAIGLNFTKHGKAFMTKECLIGVNGLKYAGTGCYRDYDWVKSQKDKGLSVQEIANACNASYHTIRKWLKIHNLQFNQLLFLTGTNGKPPWNKGVNGYKLNTSFSEDRKNKIREARSGEKSNFWRGGMSKDRDNIGRWTTQIAHKVHEKFNYTCQNCGSGKHLIAHHIIPVAMNIKLSKDFDNLITVCDDCHKSIHKNIQSENNFLLKVKSQGIITKEQVITKYKKPGGNPLRVHFEKIISVEYAGKEEVFDIQIDHPDHNFIANGCVIHNCWNEVSRRYVDTPPTYYRPEFWRGRPVNGIKQGSSEKVIHLDSVDIGIKDMVTDEWITDYDRYISLCNGYYERLINHGVAPEMARFVLPQAMNTEWVWSGSLYAWARICKERLAPEAQAETRVIAQMIDKECRRLFPNAWDALFEDKTPLKTKALECFKRLVELISQGELAAVYSYSYIGSVDSVDDLTDIKDRLEAGER